VKRAYKLRAYPTHSQEGRADRLLRDHCDLYNAALQERREAWGRRRQPISYFDQSAQLREIRANDPAGQGRHSFTAQQQTLRRLDTVFGAFRKRVRDAEQQRQRQAGKKGDHAERRVGYPRFRPYQRYNQVLFVVGDGAKWEPAIDGRWAHASFHAVGRLKVRQHREVIGRVRTLQLKRDDRRWFVLVVTEFEPEALPPAGRSVGIDVGIARFLVASDGKIVANPRLLDAPQARIAKLQQRREKAQRGSGNRRRIRRKLAREWRRVRNQRLDFHHKTARALVDAYDIISLENLKVKNLTGSAKGSVDMPGVNVRQKAALNRRILDAGWGQFSRILTAKAESAGRRVILVNPAHTSIHCHACGARCTRPVQDIVLCPRCGAWDADLNGARNIASRAGLGSGQVLGLENLPGVSRRSSHPPTLVTRRPLATPPPAPVSFPGSW
jgi:putative transposase